MVAPNPEKLAQLLPNSCGQSKKADSKDKNSARALTTDPHQGSDTRNAHHQ
jgi:hypothetical protein